MLLQECLEKEKQEGADRAELLTERLDAAEKATLTAKREAEEQREAAGEAAMTAEAAVETLRREKVGAAVLTSPGNKADAVS